MHLTTELEAVNSMLQACDEAPVPSLALSGLFPLEMAKGILNETSRTVQTLGWAFNTETITLTRNGSGLIALPPNLARFDAEDSTMVFPVVRGLRLYDKKANTFAFEADVKGAAVFMLDWEDLPQAARDYIKIKAARTMQGRVITSDATYRITERDEEAALLVLQTADADEGDFNMLQAGDTANILMPPIL